MNLLNGLTIVSERAFASMRDQGKNFVLPVNGAHYFSLESRLLQFKTNVSFVIEFVPNDLEMKEKLILRLYNEILSNIFSFNTIYKDDRVKSYFELSSRKVNIIIFFKHFLEAGKIVDRAFYNENRLFKVKLRLSRLLLFCNKALKTIMRSFKFRNNA
jgi:hypothetical protein